MANAPQKWLGEFTASTINADIQTDPVGAALKDGGFIIVWTDRSGVGGDNSGSAIKLQRFDASGSKAGVETLVNSTTSQQQGNPRSGGSEPGNSAGSSTSAPGMVSDI